MDMGNIPVRLTYDDFWGEPKDATDNSLEKESDNIHQVLKDEAYQDVIKILGEFEITTQYKKAVPIQDMNCAFIYPWGVTWFHDPIKGTRTVKAWDNDTLEERFDCTRSIYSLKTGSKIQPYQEMINIYSILTQESSYSSVYPHSVIPENSMRDGISRICTEGFNVNDDDQRRAIRERIDFMKFILLYAEPDRDKGLYYKNFVKIMNEVEGSFRVSRTEAVKQKVNGILRKSRK